MFKEIRVWSSGGLVVKMREVGAVRRGSLTARRTVQGRCTVTGAQGRDVGGAVQWMKAALPAMAAVIRQRCKAVLTTVPQGSAFDYGIDGKIACESQIARQWGLRRRV
ncbi:hypothetical protein U1Q18_022298 [Sarracenia purpurea var. burkii]